MLRLTITSRPKSGTTKPKQNSARLAERPKDFITSHSQWYLGPDTFKLQN